MTHARTAPSTTRNQPRRRTAPRQRPIITSRQFRLAIRLLFELYRLLAGPLGLPALPVLHGPSSEAAPGASPSEVLSLAEE